MALQCNADLRLLIGLLTVLFFFDLSFQFLILHLLISFCTQFSHLFIRRGYRGHLKKCMKLVPYYRFAREKLLLLSAVLVCTF